MDDNIETLKCTKCNNGLLIAILKEKDGSYICPICGNNEFESKYGDIINIDVAIEENIYISEIDRIENNVIKEK